MSKRWITRSTTTEPPLSHVGILIKRANPRTMALTYVSAASSTGRRKLGANYIAALNSSELKRPFHETAASASVFINPSLRDAASALVTTLFVESVPTAWQRTWGLLECEILNLILWPVWRRLKYKKVFYK